jgi:hypothetical protein
VLVFNQCLPLTDPYTASYLHTGPNAEDFFPQFFSGLELQNVTCTLGCASGAIELKQRVILKGSQFCGQDGLLQQQEKVLQKKPLCGCLFLQTRMKYSDSQ